jgi:hypothetical protein
MNQRTLVLLEPPVRRLVARLARAQGISISSACRDLIREALEMYEDRRWNKIASERDKGFDWGKALTHQQVWGKK